MTHEQNTAALTTPTEFVDAWIKSEWRRADLEDKIEGLNRPSKNLFVELKNAEFVSATIADNFYKKFDRDIYDEYYSELDVKISNNKLRDFLNQKN